MQVSKSLIIAAGLAFQSPSAIASEVPPLNSPLGVVTTAVGIGFSIEEACTDDKEMSCTGEVKKALQNLADYGRGKKNGWRALEKKTKKFRRFFKL